MGVMAASNFWKPIAQRMAPESDAGFVFLGTRLHGAANAVMGPLFGVILAAYAYGAWTRRRWVAPLAVAYALYVIANLFLFMCVDARRSAAAHARHARVRRGRDRSLGRRRVLPLEPTRDAALTRPHGVTACAVSRWRSWGSGVVARTVADLVVLLHLTFIVFVTLGGLLALRWRWLPWLHLPAIGWGVLLERLRGPLRPPGRLSGSTHAGVAGCARHPAVRRQRDGLPPALAVRSLVRAEPACRRLAATVPAGSC